MMTYNNDLNCKNFIFNKGNPVEKRESYKFPILRKDAKELTRLDETCFTDGDRVYND